MKIKVIDLKDEEINYYKETYYRFNKLLRQEREHNQYFYYNGYVKGWKECKKKIKNFITKHCEKYDEI